MVGGAQSSNLVQQLHSQVMSFVKKRKTGPTPPSEGFVLKLHYKYSFYLLLTIFTIVFYCWHNSELLACVSNFGGDIQVRNDYQLFCSTYVKIPDENWENGERFLLWYKWCHWVTLLLAIVCYLPRKFTKNFENHGALNITLQLYNSRAKYDPNSEREAQHKAMAYIKANLRTHDGMFYNAFFANAIALLIDISLWVILDFTIQGRFISYGWAVLPIKRDLVKFSDPMSMTFPPFADCEITPQVGIIGQRTETYGCHLLMMELYEKLFFGFWFWLVFLTSATAFYMIFLILLYFVPKFRVFILRVRLPDHETNFDDVDCSSSSSKEELIRNKKSVDYLLTTLVSKCRIGDVWLLYKLRRNLSDHRYFMLINELVHHTLYAVTVDDGEKSKSDPTQLPPNKAPPPNVPLGFLPQNLKIANMKLPNGAPLPQMFMTPEGQLVRRGHL